MRNLVKTIEEKIIEAARQKTEPVAIKDEYIELELLGEGAQAIFLKNLPEVSVSLVEVFFYQPYQEQARWALSQNPNLSREAARVIWDLAMERRSMETAHSILRNILINQCKNWDNEFVPKAWALVEQADKDPGLKLPARAMTDLDDYYGWIRAGDLASLVLSLPGAPGAEIDRGKEDINISHREILVALYLSHPLVKEEDKQKLWNEINALDKVYDVMKKGEPLFVARPQLLATALEEFLVDVMRFGSIGILKQGLDKPGFNNILRKTLTLWQNKAKSRGLSHRGEAALAAWLKESEPQELRSLEKETKLALLKCENKSIREAAMRIFSTERIR